MIATLRRLVPLVLAVLFSAVGCGTTSPTPHGTGMSRLLKPTAVVSPPDTVPAGSPLTLKGNLTGSGADTLTITAPTSGDGTLTLTDAGRRVLWRLAHVSWAGVLFFGKVHAPVIVVRSSPAYCGTGGCDYIGYTFRQGRFASLAGAPSETGPTYAYVPSKHGFVQQVETPTTAFFGFVALSRAHTLVLSNRLYDTLQHYSVETYAVRESASGILSWVRSGPVSFGPDVAVPGSYTSLAAAENFLDAAAMRLPTQEASFAAGSANLAALAAVVHRAFPLPTELAFDTRSFNRTAVLAGEPAHLLVANTSLTSLAAFSAAVQLVPVGGTWQVSGVTLTPLPLKVRTLKEVLAVLAGDRSVTSYLVSRPDAAVEAVPESPTSWLVSLDAMGPSPLLYALDAKTGRLGPPPYSSTP